MEVGSGEFRPSHMDFDFPKYQNPYELGRSKIVASIVPPGLERPAVDIGCGPGFYSRLLSNKGWRVTALDTDPQNIERVRNCASEVHVGDAISVLSGLPAHRHDLALALELIEHMPKTQGATLLRQICRVLRPGGRLIISTPNRLSPEGLGGYFWGEKLRGRKWLAWEPTHAYIYSSFEILRLVKRCGFTVESVTGYYYEGDLPLIGHWRLPLTQSGVFPFNRLGFDLILVGRKRPSV